MSRQRNYHRVKSTKETSFQRKSSKKVREKFKYFIVKIILTKSSSRILVESQSNIIL